MIKCKPQGIYYRQRKGVVVGKEENRHFLSRAARSFLRAQFARELADVFEKNEKKNKTMSVYRLVERVIKYKPQRIYCPPVQGCSFSRARRCFRKERKEK